MVRVSEDKKIREFNEIYDLYRDYFTITKVISIDHSKGEETGEALYLCDSFEEACKVDVGGLRTIILPGLNRCSTLGGFV